MAYSNSALRSPTVLEQLLEEINFQRTKEMRQLLKDDSGFVMLQGTTYWTDLFVRHFLFQNDATIDCDDLLFFVRKKHVKGSPRYLPKFQTEVDVYRKDSRKLPIGDPDIDWEETVYLNLIIHQFEYTLTLAICTRTSPKELQVLKRHSQKVYASPSRRRMDSKGEVEEITFPHVCFMVDNFDEVFQDILVRDGEMVCVELVAADRAGSVQGVIFLGSIRYDALKKVYDARQSSLSSKMAQRMTFGLFSSSASQRCEFVRMKGPQGKGHAEMAVTKPKGSGVETPTSEPGFCATDLWDDSDWDEDPEEYYTYKQQRRLSDPSANINNFVRGGWKTMTKLDVKSRSECEGLDSFEHVSEIEGGDLRDDVVSGPASTRSTKSLCCGCFYRRRSSIALSELYGRKPCMSSNCAKRAPIGPSDACACNLINSNGKILLDGSSEYEIDNNSTKYTKYSNNKSSVKPSVKSYEFEFGDDVTNSLTDDTEEAKKESTMAESSFIQQRSSVKSVRGKEEFPGLVKQIRNISGSMDLNNKLKETTEQLNSNSPSSANNNNKRDLENNFSANNTKSSEFSLNSKIYGLCTLPKRMKSKRIFGPPKRITPDGTHIYYWCDSPRPSKNELDDGAYNPLWTMRGFTQTFHFWKENKRAQSVPLNAFLTYVTLPWWSIAKDILDHREDPILTF